MGGTNSGDSRRQLRLSRIMDLEIFVNRNLGWSKQRIIAEFQLKTGLTYRTTTEYLKVLLDSKRILPW